MRCLWVLSLSLDAGSWGNRRAAIGHSAGILHFLSLFLQRYERLVLLRAGFYVCLSRSEGRTALENLRVGSVSRSFHEPAFAVGVFCTAPGGHGAHADKKTILAMVLSLCSDRVGVSPGSQSLSCSERDRIWFAPENRRLLLVSAAAAFSLAYVPTANAAMFCREFALRPTGFLAANIFGSGTVFVAAFVLLICIGFFFLRLSRIVICFFLADLAFLVATLTYLYPDGRYYLQLLIFLIPVAVLPVVWAIKNLFLHKRLLPSLGVLILFVASCLGFPSRSGYKPTKINRSQALDAIHYHKWHSEPLWYSAEKRFEKIYGQQPGVVLSDIDPVYLNALLPDHFAAAPIDEKQLRPWSPVWHYAQPQAAALVKQGLERSVPVYALFISRKDVTAEAGRLPKIDGYEWVETHASRPRCSLEAGARSNESICDNAAVTGWNRSHYRVREIE